MQKKYERLRHNKNQNKPINDFNSLQIVKKESLSKVIEDLRNRLDKKETTVDAENAKILAEAFKLKAEGVKEHAEAKLIESDIDAFDTNEILSMIMVLSRHVLSPMSFVESTLPPKDVLTDDIDIGETRHVLMNLIKLLDPGEIPKKEK